MNDTINFTIYFVRHGKVTGEPSIYGSTDVDIEPINEVPVKEFIEKYKIDSHFKIVSSPDPCEHSGLTSEYLLWGILPSAYCKQHAEVRRLGTLHRLQTADLFLFFCKESRHMTCRNLPGSVRRGSRKRYGWLSVFSICLRWRTIFFSH